MYLKISFCKDNRINQKSEKTIRTIYTITLYSEKRLHLKARTILLYPRKVPMPHDAGFGIVLLQPFQQTLEGEFLFRCTGIGWPVAGIQPTLVADADAVGVVARSVRPHLIEGTTAVNYPVAGDVVVIADVGEATGTVVTTAVVHGVTLRGAGGTTMDHNQVDAAIVLVLAAVSSDVIIGAFGRVDFGVKRGVERLVRRMKFQSYIVG